MKYHHSLSKTQMRTLVRLGWFQNFKNQKLRPGLDSKGKVVKQFTPEAVWIQFFQASPTSGLFSSETRRAGLNKRGEWMTTHCEDNKPEITSIKKKINTADPCSGNLPLCRELGCHTGKQRQKQVWCHGEACRQRLH